MIDFKKIGEFFTKKNLWDKPFNRWSRDEIESLAEVFFSSPGPGVPADGWQEPHIDERGRLVIPCRVHPRFRWWMPDGMSVVDTINFICDREKYCKFCRDEMIHAHRPIGWDPNGIKHS